MNDLKKRKVQGAATKLHERPDQQRQTAKNCVIMLKNYTY
jgi:hypothetical protein